MLLCSSAIKRLTQRGRFLTSSQAKAGVEARLQFAILPHAQSGIFSIYNFLHYGEGSRGFRCGAASAYFT